MTGYSTFPNICLGETAIPIDPEEFENVVIVALPKACTYVTITLSYFVPGALAAGLYFWVDGSFGAVASNPHHIDRFERTRASGWGTADTGMTWSRAFRGGPVRGAVNNGDGVLPVTRSIEGAETSIYNGVGDIVVIGQFTNCQGPTEYLFVSGAKTVVLDTDGRLAASGATIDLADFDPCAPWILRFAWTEGSSLLIRAWQAAMSEPDTGLVLGSPVSLGDTFRFRTRADDVAGANDAVRIDLVDLVQLYQPSG